MAASGPSLDATEGHGPSGLRQSNGRRHEIETASYRPLARAPVMALGRWSPRADGDGDGLSLGSRTCPSTSRHALSHARTAARGWLACLLPSQTLMRVGHRLVLIPVNLWCQIAAQVTRFSCNCSQIRLFSAFHSFLLLP
jgi:hypothetical protein